MKKHLLLLALLGSAATAARAQSPLAAGTIAVGGDIGYSGTTDKVEDSSPGGRTTENFYSQFVFKPQAAYFVADNAALGLKLSLTASRLSKIDGSTTVTSKAATLLRVGAFGQYYQMLSDQFGVVGTVDVGYQRQFVPAGDATGSGVYAALTPSIIFLPVPKFGITASVGSIGYDRLSFTSPGQPDTIASKQTNFGAVFGLSQLLFGGTYFIGR